MTNVSHEQIYERLLAVEAKVDEIDKNTKDLVDAIDAATHAISATKIRKELGLEPQ